MDWGWIGDGYDDWGMVIGEWGMGDWGIGIEEW